jgi:hypothetical protein
MKIRTRFLFAAAIVGAALMAPQAQASTYDSTVESYDPLAYYTFTNQTGNQTQSAVNGYTLTLENGATIVSGAGPIVNGRSTPALVLDNGSSGQAYATSVGASGLMGGVSTSGTILATIDLASLPSTYGRIYSIAGESASGDDLDFQIDGSNTINFYSHGGGAVATAPLTSADLNEPIFLVATFTSGGSANIYIDGSLAATTYAFSRYDSGAPFYVGQSNVFGDRYFDGSISDVAVYDTALTAADISNLYASATAPGTISAAPEPSTWLLMIAGIGGIGLMLRRAKTAVGLRDAAALAV